MEITRFLIIVAISAFLLGFLTGSALWIAFIIRLFKENTGRDEEEDGPHLPPHLRDYHKN